MVLSSGSINPSISKEVDTRLLQRRVLSPRGVELAGRFARWQGESPLLRGGGKKGMTLTNALKERGALVAAKKKGEKKVVAKKEKRPGSRIVFILRKRSPRFSRGQKGSFP